MIQNTRNSIIRIFFPKFIDTILRTMENKIKNILKIKNCGCMAELEEN